MSHLVDGHGFPRNYEWRVVEQGVDGKRSLLREEKPERTRRRSLTLQKKIGVQSTGKATKDAESEMDVDQVEKEMVKLSSQTTELSIAAVVSARDSKVLPPAADEAMEIDDLVGAMSSLRFVPPSVRFGKGKGRPKSSKS